MLRKLTICCLVCMLAAMSWANESIKVDAVTGATSNGKEITASNPLLLSEVNERMAWESELADLYIEAYARKYAEQDDAPTWARIAELNTLLNGRAVDARLDEGGETCDNAFVISSLPFCDTGNTSDNLRNYVPPVGARCGLDPSGEPVQGSGRDVVYVYTPATTEIVSVSLCGSEFDTYLHIYQGGCPGSDNSVQVCCNDDHAGTCPAGSANLVSCCPAIALVGGSTYYIIVDGWNTNSSGAYQISISYEDHCGPCPPPPSCVECPENGYHSIEPVCFNGYVDQTNSGCVAGAQFFEAVTCNTTICGTGGRYLGPSGTPISDVDYYLFTVDSESESLYVRLRADANGQWGLFRVNSANICDDNAQTVFNQSFERCQERIFSGCVTPGVYALGVVLFGEIPCGTPYTMSLHCLDCPDPTGRCCYRTEDGPACADEWTREECAVVGGLWTLNATCEECCPTNFCEDWIEVPGVYEYTHTENSCCSVPVNFCVGENGCDDEPCYPANRAVIYQIVLESDAVISLSASGPGDNQLLVFTDCNDPTGSCVASADNGLPFIGGTEEINGLLLTAGTYFIATSHFFWDNFPCGPIVLHITSDTPLPVELLGFDAIAMDGAVKLVWSTASESNASHFDIRRDGELINRITATNSATGSSYMWIDEDVENGRLCAYDLVAVDLNGVETVVGSESAMPSATSAEVTDFALHQNYPNPFNPETRIAFDLPQSSDVSLTVINSLGQEVSVLANGVLSAGRHEVTFDGSALPSGLYFYHLQAGGFSQLHKMVLLK